MKGLLAIDPGLRACGVAIFDETGTLRRAWCLENKYPGNGPDVWFKFSNDAFFDIRSSLSNAKIDLDTCVIEIPQIYRISKGDPNDLIDVAGVAGAIGSSFRLESAKGYKPREWKGSVPKTTHTQRTLAQLSEVELTKISEKRATLRHNAIDAAGIGLYHLERLGIRKRKVILRPDVAEEPK